MIFFFSRREATSGKLSAVVAAIALIGGWCCRGADDVNEKIIRHSKRFTVAVVRLHMDEKKQSVIDVVHGTAFLIDRRGRFLTAAHVIKDGAQTVSANPGSSLGLYVREGSWSERDMENIKYHTLSFNRLAVDDGLDLFLGEPTVNPFEIPEVGPYLVAAEIGETEIEEGGPAAFTGFPLQFRFPVSSKGFVAFISRFKDVTKWPDLVIDKTAWPGASGSPVFDVDGIVCGMILARQREESGGGLAYARSARAIRDFLGRNNWPPKQNPQQKHP